MRKYYILIILISCLHIAARGQTADGLEDIDLSELPQPTQAKALRYWFDDNITTLNTVTVLSGTQRVDASMLLDGLHTIHYQVVDNNDQVCHSVSGIFIKMTNGSSEQVSANKLVYCFDDEIAVKSFDMANGLQELDVSHLLDGLHTIHYQVLCNNEQMTATQSALFMRISQTTEATIAKSLRYWFDDDEASLKVITVDNSIQILDVSGLMTGVHTLHYQIIDNNGRLGTPVTDIFIKNFEKAIIDNENRILEYQYWLNDKSQVMYTVTIDERTNPYSLISLLPVHKEPIRSKLFQFEITDDQPSIYAKNEFHVRFHDAAGYYSDDFRTFVDYSVKQTITDLELLESGERSTITKPADNDIKWYKLTAEPGDSVQFRLDRAATVQLFSPSGKELQTISGSESVSWFGCHVRESGTYYLALHDVTSQYGDEISIDYNHIDKYAVLRQDVSVVGNGGCSTITFEGNGFRDLYAVDFLTEQGDSIHHIYIGHESDATTSVVFDFTDAVLGQYNALFHFADENRVIKDCLNVEEAKEITLDLNITYPVMFLKGTATTYTVKITNNGNMTAYAVPVYTYIKSKADDGVYGIRYKGLGLPSLADVICEGMPELRSDNSIKNLSDSICDDWHFFKMSVEDEEHPGEKLIIRSNFFFINISPNSTKTISLSLFTREDEVFATFTVPEDWRSFSDIPDSDSRGKNNIVVDDDIASNYCCVKDILECLGDLIVNDYDLASIACSVIPGLQEFAPLVSTADCAASLINSLFLKPIGYLSCGKGGSQNGGSLPPTNLGSLMGTAISCLSVNLEGAVSAASGVAGIATSNWGQNWEDILIEVGRRLIYGPIEMPVGAVLCLVRKGGRGPDCLPKPKPDGPSIPVKSLDPNEIYGYTAESGSKAVKDGLTYVYYRIEFENDPEFATAAAHDIYVSDQLDGSMFDLSTFTPTRVKIGDKTAELSGEKNFVTTIDMRPSINAIAQVEGTFDETTGLAQWHISSLDPMTMEPTQYVMDGVLPVNTDGRGIGEVMYDIALKDGLAHGTEVPNQATIVFDTNEPILTPVWTNVIDRIAPESHITEVEQVDDGETATVSIEATDDGSGPWRYDVYVQYGTGAWFRAAENVPVNSTATVKLYSDIEHHFYAVAKDMAGNVEEKEPVSEFTLNVGTVIIKGDANGDGSVTITDAVAVVNYILGNPSDNFHETAADVNGDGNITITDAVGIVNIILNGGASAPALSEPEEAGQVPE